MVHSCCAQGCKERFVKGSGISFHGFPCDEELKKKWVIALRREKFVPTAYTRICSKHFTPESFVAERFGNRWLKPDAVPSIFGFSQQKKKTTPREPPETSSEFSEPVMSTVSQGECLGSARLDGTIDVDPSKDLLQPGSERLHGINDTDAPKDSLQSGSARLDGTIDVDPPKDLLQPGSERLEGIGDISPPIQSLQPGCSGERKRPLRYIGDFSEVEMSSPTTAKKFLSLAMEHMEVQRRKIKYLQTKEARLKKRVKFLESILRQVKEKSRQKDDACSALELRIIGPQPSETLVEREDPFCGKGTRRGKVRGNGGVGKVKGVNGQNNTLEAHQQHNITQCELSDNLVAPLDLTMCQPNSSS